MQMLQPDEEHALSPIYDRKRFFLVSGNQSCTGWGQTASAREAHAPASQLAPSCHNFRSGCSLLFITGVSFISPGGHSTVGHHAPPPLFWECKLKGRVLPGCIYIAAALFAGTGAPLSSGVRCSCSLAAQKPASLRGRCVVVGQLGCVSWIASKIVFCFNRPEWLMILTFALIAV